MSEIVYVFANPAMPKLIKIGRTSRDDVEKRRKELSNHSGVPAPFVFLYAAEVADAKKVESALHAAFDVDRDNKDREFFSTTPERIIVLLEAFGNNVTPAVQKVLDEATSTEEKRTQQAFVATLNKRQGKFNFSKHGIPVGAELVFARDPTVKCKVADNSNVEYKGKALSLSALARELLGRVNDPPGPSFFTYKGELLSDIRKKLERET